MGGDHQKGKGEARAMETATDRKERATLERKTMGVREKGAGKGKSGEF